MDMNAADTVLKERVMVETHKMSTGLKYMELPVIPYSLLVHISEIHNADSTPG